MSLGILQLALIATSGYLLHEIAYARCWTRRHQGYALYFRVLVYGLAALLLVSLFIEHEKDLSLRGPEVVTFVVAFGLYLLSQFLGRFRSTEDFYCLLERRYLENEQFFELQAAKAMHMHQPLMITPGNGKVYIGTVSGLRSSGGAKWITLSTMFSGFRDKDTHELEITTAYRDLLEKQEGATIIPEVTISIDKSVTAQPFDLDIYSRFQDSA